MCRGWEGEVGWGVPDRSAGQPAGAQLPTSILQHNCILRGAGMAQLLIYKLYLVPLILSAEALPPLRADRCQSCSVCLSDAPFPQGNVTKEACGSKRYQARDVLRLHTHSRRDCRRIQV